MKYIYIWSQSNQNNIFYYTIEFKFQLIIDFFMITNLIMEQR